MSSVETNYPETEGMEELVEEVTEITVQPACAGVRIDSFIANSFSELSRSYVQKLVADGHILVNEKVIKSNYKVKPDDVIRVEIPDVQEIEIAAESIPLDILYEDSDVIVLNKPQGMVVHPAPGNYSGTLVNALLFHCRDLSGINGVMRPGIVHRLDKDTSGVIMAAKNDLAHEELARQIKDRTVVRRYLVLVDGVVREPAGIVDAPIGRDPRDRKKMAVVARNSKNAVTHYQVLERFVDYTFVECRLETGRTHQIRVHMKYIQHPVVGDTVYGTNSKEFDLNGQLLHATSLGFTHPRTGKMLEFEAPLPGYFQEVLNILRNN